MSQDQNTKDDPSSLHAIDFGTFLISLSTSALVHLGEMADAEVAQGVQVDLVLAKQTIDIVDMLKEKTRGNLTPEEENLINHVQYDLRIRYVKKTKESQGTKK